VDLYSALSSHL